MNKRNFLKITILSISLAYIKKFKFVSILSNKLVLKKQNSKIWFLHINDL